MSKKSKTKNKRALVSNDGFENLLTGMGTRRDALSYNNFVRGRSITQNFELVSSLYSQNWLASAVIDVPINDMTRNWITLLDEDEERIDVIDKEMDRLDVKHKINQALKWASAFGGSVIIMLVDDGRALDMPLTKKAVRENGVKNLIVLDRWKVTTSQSNQDLLSTNFGLPDYYMVSRSGQRIHHSRVLRFDGDIKSIEEFERQGYWGNSSFEKMWGPISESQSVSMQIANMTKESNIDVYKIDGLNEMVAMGVDGEVAAKKRLSVAHEMKSYINGIALDKNDDYEKKSNTFSGLADIDDKFLLKVSGASQIPLSKLLGKTDAGLNGNGEGDLKNYYDNISGRQEVEIKNQLKTLIDIIYMSKFNEDKTVSFEFNPLWQMSQEQQATISLNRANRDAIYVEHGIVSVDTIQKQLSADQTYGSIDEDISITEELFDEN